MGRGTAHSRSVLRSCSVPPKIPLLCRNKKSYNWVEWSGQKVSGWAGGAQGPRKIKGNLSTEREFVHSMDKCKWHGKAMKCPLTVCLFVLRVVPTKIVHKIWTGRFLPVLQTFLDTAEYRNSTNVEEKRK